MGKINSIAFVHIFSFQVWIEGYYGVDFKLNQHLRERVRVFLKKEEDFLKQGYKVLNSYSARKMFKSEGIESLAVFPEQSSCLAEAFDIRKVYSTLTSDTKSF